VWSIGVIAYQLITLRFPFKCEQTGATAVAILNNPHDPILDKNFSDELKDIIYSMLTKDPEQRPSIQELAREPIIFDAINLFIKEFENTIFFELRNSLPIARVIDWENL
jgi:serine/threonine protein kinase